MDTHYDIVTLTTVASTQDEARSRYEHSGSATLVLADEQVAGRGRQGRSWTQPDRGLFASFAFTSDWAMADRTLIPLIAGVAMRRAVTGVAGSVLGLKWPNDLKLDTEKVGGILVESTEGTVVVGCGLNLWWADPIQGATSLYEQDPGPNVVNQIARAWADALLDLLAGQPSGWPRDEYEAASVTLGHVVSWDGGTGRAIGIADNGALRVEVDGGTVELHSGEVHTALASHRDGGKDRRGRTNR